MAKDTQINFRIDSELKEQIEAKAKAEGYDSYTKYIIDLFKKAVDPNTRLKIDNQLDNSNRLTELEETVKQQNDRLAKLEKQIKGDNQENKTNYRETSLEDEPQATKDDERGQSTKPDKREPSEATCCEPVSNDDAERIEDLEYDVVELAPHEVEQQQQQISLSHEQIANEFDNAISHVSLSRYAKKERPVPKNKHEDWDKIKAEYIYDPESNRWLKRK